MNKTVVIHGEAVELFSLDDENWSTDLPQLQRRMQQREKNTEQVLDEARRFFRKRVGL